MRNYQKYLLDPEQCVTLIIDHQPQMYFGVEGESRQTIRNNVTGLAKAAKLFNVPCVLTTVAAKTFSGNMIESITDVYPGTKPIDRTSLNAWEDPNLKRAVESTGRRKAVLAGLWTEACIVFPALSMLSENYEIYVALDACGGATPASHEAAVQRLIQSGAVPMTWMQVMLEWQRDWSNKDTFGGVMSIIREHGGAYGIGVEYADSIIPQAGRIYPGPVQRNR